MRTIAHVYDSYAEASRVVSSLEAAGVPASDISLVSGDKSAGGSSTGVTSGDTAQGAATGAGAGATLGTAVGGGAGLLAGLGALVIPGVGPLVAAGWLVAAVTGAGVGAAAGGLLGSLTGAGLSEADARTYSEGVERGGTLVSVRVEEAQAPRIEAMMKGAATGSTRTASMQAGSTQAGSIGTTGVRDAGTDETIQVVRENLVVGKREVESGSVRVTSHVVETPVQEQVSLRDEVVRVERRPVNEAAGAVPADAFQERVIEVRAMGEEAVVQKDVRVVEEIAIHKQVTDRVETVRDTVRETKVEIDDGTTTGKVRPDDTTPRR